MSLHIYPTSFHNKYLFRAGKSQRGRLVNWVGKAGFKNIQKLLEIFELERHHEILLTVKNLCELSRNPSPYVLPVIPCPLPSEIEKGKHYVIADLLNLAPVSSPPAQTSETEVVGRELVINIRPEQPSLAREYSDPTPQAFKKVDRGSRLEGFPFTKKDSCPAPQASKKGRRVPKRRRAPGARVEDLPFGLPPYLASPLLAKRKKRRTRWLTSFITLAHISANGAPTSSGRRMLPLLRPPSPARPYWRVQTKTPGTPV